MKIKLLVSSLLMAGAMMASGNASAYFWSGTVTDWINGTGTLNPAGPPPSQVAGTITDEDGDINFTFGGLSGDLAGTGDWIDVVLDEVEIGGVDLYTVNFDFNFLDENSPFFDVGYTGNGGNIEYSMTVIPPSNEWITSVALDSETDGNIGEYVTKDLYDSSFTGTPFLTLTSTNGNTAPLGGGHEYFDPRKSVYVKDTLYSNGAIITHVDNEFDVSSVPEPMTLTLMGIGLAAFGARRRFA